MHLQPWTNDEDEYLRANYRLMTGSQIAAVLNRTRSAVIGRAGRLGLCKPQASGPPKTKVKSRRQPRPRRFVSPKSRNPSFRVDPIDVDSVKPAPPLPDRFYAGDDPIAYAMRHRLEGARHER